MELAGPTQYGENPPAVGVDFFQGPYQDNDGVDNPLYTNCEVAQALSEGRNCLQGNWCRLRRWCCG
jgi:hypothetical protein